MKKQPECPECEKLVSVSSMSNEIGDFLNWLDRQGVILATYDRTDDLVKSDYRLTNRGINEMLAEYFGIDLDKVEKERRALLEWIREQHESAES